MKVCDCTACRTARSEHPNEIDDDRRSGRRMAVMFAALFVAVVWFATDGGEGSMPEELPVTYEEVGE